MQYASCQSCPRRRETTKPVLAGERMEMKPNCRPTAVAASHAPRTDDEHPPSSKEHRQLSERRLFLNQMTDPSSYAFAPRLLRLRDAPRYLGMDKNRFN